MGSSLPFTSGERHVKTSLREKPKHLWREGKQGEGWGAAAEKVSCEQLWREGGHALRAPWEPRPEGRALLCEGFEKTGVGWGEPEEDQGPKSPGEGGAGQGLRESCRDGWGWGGVGAGKASWVLGQPLSAGEWATLERGTWARDMGLHRTVGTPGPPLHLAVAPQGISRRPGLVSGRCWVTSHTACNAG